MKRFQIFVEGIADKKFVLDYIHHAFQRKAPDDCIISTGGYKKLKSEEIRGAMLQNMDQGGINVVIFDADENAEARREELLSIRGEIGVEFELFLLPNDKDSGELEDLLERIINPDNKPIMDCWEMYEKKLGEVRIPTKTPPNLTIPAKKTKIYAYLETLLGKSRSQKNLIKERERKYENPQHWNLNAEYLEPLKAFLAKTIL